MSILNLLPILIILSGTFFIIKTRFFYILHPIRTLKFTFKGENTKSALKSLTLALAGTIGVGNIVGVIHGIRIGGAGSIFWLVISALFSSAIKYAEVSLSAKSAKGLGMIGVIEDTRGMKVGFPKLYAALALALSLLMGCLVQSNAIFSSARALGINVPALATVLATLLTTVLFLGTERIKNAVAFIVPLASIVYTGLCFSVIFVNIEALRDTALRIINSAFNFKSILGGAAAFLVSTGIKEGFARGLLSNEAGAGTSSFSHTALGSNDAERAGCFGILEVIFDTVLICPMTGIALLSALPEGASISDVGTLSDLFASSIGDISSILLFLSILFFAFSTVLCWYYYGTVCIKYLFPKIPVILYTFIFIAVFIIGGVTLSDTVILLTDVSLFFISLISLTALIKRSDGVLPPSDL